MAENRRTCSSCGTANEEDARYCEGCGGSLARVCATCGLEARATARFCRGCGAPLDELATPTTEPPIAGPARKTVTVMFADLAGSTTFEEKVDAETAREVIGRYHELLRSTAQRHRAGVTKYIGDGFMAVWGVPEIGPEDALRAVDAAVELQDRFVDLAAQVAETHRTELALRVAVNTGEVVVGAGDADLVGDALNVGARLEAECPRGRVVVGEETWRATRGRYGYESLGQVQVKGRHAPVAVYQWVGRHSDVADAAPFVGRSQEIKRLQNVLDDAIAARAARLVTVIGDPGVGKSRLATEFLAAQSDACVLQARCAVEGSVALAPIVEMLRARDLESDIPAGTSERDRLLRDLKGLATGVPGSVEENFWALRRFVEVLAWSGPVVFALDDIQWADSLLLDFIEHVVEWIKDVPVLVLALARPELREIRPDLVAASRWVTDTLHLDGLDAGATAELAAKVLGATELPPELLHRLPASTGGNPLFVREFVGMLAHDGVLVEHANGWRLTIDVEAITIPPTIQALLASRLERLDTGDRRILEIASVIGSDFSVGTVGALAGGHADAIKLSLNRLRRLELAQPTGTYVGDEAVWRFHHVLIRDVAYRRLLKSERAGLHERLADWVESGGASVAFEADEMIARHLEAAHTYRSELGTLDEHTNDLALRAARHYSASARRALDRDELVSAGAQATRGAALAGAAESIHAELLMTGCEALLSAGDVTTAAALVEDLERIAGDALAPWATCYRCQFGVYTDPDRLLEYDALLQGAIDEFARRADPAGLAKAHRVRASARLRLGRVGDGEVDLFEALIAARQSKDHRQITAALSAAPGAALWGPSPVPKAGGRCLDVVRMQRMTTAAPSLEATSLRHLAVLELLRGRPDKARKMLGEARQIVADLGLRHGLMETELFAGIIESMSGDPVAAEPHFRMALEGLDALGAGADAGLAAALLARSVLAQGRMEEADRYAAESERLAGHNLKTAIAWRAVRAEILATQGCHGEATAMARDAVAVASGTDIVLDHAEACLALSRVLDQAGDIKGARAARADARALYAAKEASIPVGLVGEPVVAPSEEPARTAPGHAEERAPATSGRLAVDNDSCRLLPRFIRAIKEHDVESALLWFSEEFVYDDRRRLSGDPVVGVGAMRTAIERVFEQYTHFEVRVLAVRGRHLHLLWSRWADDDGNAATTLYVNETNDDGRILYHIRFDEDDFESAYLELERRYYAGDGAAFAEAGAVALEFGSALHRGDLDRAFGELTADDFRVLNRSRAMLPDLSASEFRGILEELDAMVASRRLWISALQWVSPNCVVIRIEQEAIGHEGEKYEWARIHVGEIRGGRLASMCQFEVDDEAAAFAYAEERVRAATSRLEVINHASQQTDASWRARLAGDVEGAIARYSTRYAYDDRRRLSGNPIAGLEELRVAAAQFYEQYQQSEWRILAVRGERVELRWSRWWDDAGNETAGLHLHEIDEEGRIFYQGRFDEDDFTGAYGELERRYYFGEGAAYAEAGAVTREWITALNDRDYDRLIDELTSESYRLENRSSSAFDHRTATDVRRSFEDFDAAVASARSWEAAVCWLSPKIGIFRFEREAVGRDGERYSWTWLDVCEIRDGRLASACRFDLEDEDAAFAYAEDRVRATTSRLAVANKASQAANVAWRAFQVGDLGAAMAGSSDEFVYDDRRRMSGNAIEGLDGLRSASVRILDQYPHSEWRTLAVRGERLELGWSRWWDDAGNETSGFHVLETDGDGLTIYHGRFDEDDFEEALGELERRYYAGEGAEFAEGGAVSMATFAAINRGDYDRVFVELVAPDMRIENRSRTAFPDRSANQLRSGWGQLDAMVSSSRSWPSVISWLSPQWSVSRVEREATGDDGELYKWTSALVVEVRDGRTNALCQFDIEDEEAAFAYAEECVRAASSRLAVKNRATDVVEAGWQAMRSHDVEGLVATYADAFVYVDRRRLSGDPIVGRDAIRAAIQRVLDQYSRFEAHVLAVRGDRLAMVRSRWWDEAGNETTQLHVSEIGDDGLCIYDYRFDGDDFEGAYRELDRRYSVGEGAAYADAAVVLTDYACAENRGDFERLFGELTTADFRVENRSRSVFGDRSATEFRSSREELQAMVDSVRSWHSAMRWLSPTVVVGRLEREALGHDGEVYVWSFITVAEVDNGRLAWTRIFEIDDEKAAFDYAQERVHAPVSRLTVHNRACDVGAKVLRDFEIGDIDAVVAAYSDHFAYDDHRRLSGDPVTTHAELKSAGTRLRQHYSHFTGLTLAVRGERLQLAHTRWSDDAANETAHLLVIELADDGRIAFQATYDENDFMSAYRELDTRYFAGEGALFAEAGVVTIEYAAALNNRDLDRLFGELSVDGLRIENRSRSAFPDRSATELRKTLEDLSSIVASVREWHSASCWLSPNVCVGRHEREAIEHDGERYSWTRLMVFEVRDGRMASMCVFEPDDEHAAFAYAEELVLEAATRLPVTNMATRTFLTGERAANAHDVDAMVRQYSEHFEYDDRRKLAGNPLPDVRSGAERILAQYNRFEGRTLAVRGDRLQLGWSRWSTDAGYETTHLILHEVDDSGRITYEGRFDEDDFEHAYRELTRRYCVGEGAAVAEAEATLAEYPIGFMNGDIDGVFDRLTTPGLRIDDRSRSLFGERSAGEFRSTYDELLARASSLRVWHAAVCWLSPAVVVARFEQTAVGADGERFAWTHIDVVEIRDGRFSSVCLFETDDEQAAFAYAEDVIRSANSRLTVSNLATRTVENLWRALQAQDVDAAAELAAESFTFGDHRRLHGNPVGDTRTALARILEDYTSFESRTLAVRGERLHLGWARWANDDGFEVRYLTVHQVDDAGRILYHGRFDEDDFEGAYRELTRRYCAGEAADFSQSASIVTEWMSALNAGDFDGAFALTSPDFRIENRSRTAFPDRSAAELRASLEDLWAMMTTIRQWNVAEHWLSPDCVVARNERQAVGRGGEQYTWSSIDVGEIRDGRAAHVCRFDIDDEEAAFAYAEERAHTVHSRFRLTNRSCETVAALQNALCARDLEGGIGCYANPSVYEDRRRLSGDPIRTAAGLRLAGERILAQYSHFQWRTLAIRGDYLSMHSSVWSDDSGNATNYLHVYEVDDTGHFIYEGRFDEDDFESAYQELTRRYCEGEGAPVAEGTVHNARYLAAINRREWDRVFGEMSTPDMHAVSRARSGFPDRSVADLRASYENLCSMVASVRSWHSIERWVSPTVGVTLHEREAIGHDGERYEWSRLIVGEFSDGLTRHICQFDVDDEDAAFAYAEEVVRRAGTSSVET
ncbi:nuclear transport factor 2 family protein [Mycobacterium sp. 1164985.4]|uniref:nuclear transport factor 2 family protein n=1 Tax=Mycobacterium sp. 1164985.4 TaxID=1834069 RepID=UPI000800F0C0|nr:nuclear transport factor 2 family protein [Mycobacterium sp. 1164985.4]OBK72686.1 adenylate cyclase [Mycobacterium sp. 1164985.4]